MPDDDDDDNDENNDDDMGDAYIAKGRQVRDRLIVRCAQGHH